MTLTSFLKECAVGTVVRHTATKEEGRVLKISKDNDKALVQYSDGSKYWTEYYLLEFEFPNE